MIHLDVFTNSIFMKFYFPKEILATSNWIDTLTKITSIKTLVYTQIHNHIFPLKII